jgi:hypothetical protein
MLGLLWVWLFSKIVWLDPGSANCRSSFGLNIFGLLTMSHRNTGCYLADGRSADVDGGPCHLLGKDLLPRNRFAAALITQAFTKLLASIYPTTVR